MKLLPKPDRNCSYRTGLVVPGLAPGLSPGWERTPAVLYPRLCGLPQGVPLRATTGAARLACCASRLQTCQVWPLLPSGSACVVEVKNIPCWRLQSDEDGIWNSFSCLQVLSLLYHSCFILLYRVLYFTLETHSLFTFAIISFVSRQPTAAAALATSLALMRRCPTFPSIFSQSFCPGNSNEIYFSWSSGSCVAYRIVVPIFFTFDQLERAISWIIFLFTPRQPPVSESHWRMLLQDMLTMQQNVYTCLDSDACYEVTLHM